MPNQLAMEISYQLAQPNLMNKEKIDPLDSKRKCHQVSDRWLNTILLSLKCTLSNSRIFFLSNTNSSNLCSAVNLQPISSYICLILPCSQLDICTW